MATSRVTLPDGRALTIDDHRWAAIEPVAPVVTQPVRLAYAAAHIAMRESYAGIPYTPDSPGRPEEIAEHIDWDATLAVRRHLISHGFGIAEAMDTAQRYEVGWPVARELIRLCAALAPPVGFVAGAGSDQFPAISGPGDLIDAAVEQCAFIRAAGGIPMILAMPWLSLNRCAPDQYVDVYTRIIRLADGPLFIHWLGAMFLPLLEGYFPGDSFDRVMAIDPEKVRGVKLSLLDSALEIRIRRRLLERDQIVLTGDDFHFGALIHGTGEPERWTKIAGRPVALGNFSHALLGILDAIAAPAGLALRCLAGARADDYLAIMSPCEILARKIFEPPTQHYKAGLVFLAWLNDLQSNPMLPNHQERSRSREHLIAVAELAATAGAIVNAECAAHRLQNFLRA